MHLDLQIVQHLPLAHCINRHLRHKILRAQEVRGGILVLHQFLLFAKCFSATVISWWIFRCTLISNGFFPCNCAPGSNDAAAPVAAGAALPWQCWACLRLLIDVHLLAGVMQVVRSDLSLRIQIKTCARVLVECQLPLPSAFGSVTSISLPNDIG